MLLDAAGCSRLIEQVRLGRAGRADPMQAQSLDDQETRMQLGFVGLGKMGLNMVTRLDARRPRRSSPSIAAPTPSAQAEAARRAAASPRSRRSSTALAAAARGLGDGARRRCRPNRPSPRSARCCRPATSIIDGGNTNFHDDVRRARRRWPRSGIHYVDAGTSGGIWGLQEGYCLMVGGEADVCTRLEPIFLTLAPDGRLPARRRPRRRPLREDGPQRASSTG